MKRVYHPWWVWEEVKHNMWGAVDDRQAMLRRAIEFTGDHKLYGRWMRKVIAAWPNSCENALTDASLNKRAWIGHAACAMAFRCPEDIVRQAWGHLSDEQRLLANKEAERALRLWQDAYEKDHGLRDDLGEPLL